MDPDIPTVDGYLDEWLALLRTRVKPSTWDSYRTMAEAYIRPRLGEVRLDELTVRQLDRLYVELLESEDVEVVDPCHGVRSPTSTRSCTRPWGTRSGSGC